jgi:hypothetical protein
MQRLVAKRESQGQRLMTWAGASPAQGKASSGQSGWKPLRPAPDHRSLQAEGVQVVAAGADVNHAIGHGGLDSTQLPVV